MDITLPLADLFASEDWFALLDVSLTGIHLVRPVYESDGLAIVDFAIEYLNPAGQRMMGLPEQPGGTLLNLFPHPMAEGIFTYYRRVFESGDQFTYETNCQADELDDFFRFSAQRSGAYLLVSFTNTSDQNRNAVEQTLRETQAAEQAAYAVAEQQRQRFREVLTQMPAYIAVHQGPDHIYQFVNPAYQSLFPYRSFLGKPFREGTPEADDLGIVALFDQVYRTGEPVYLREMEAWFDFTGNGQPVQVFLNISLHPLRDVQGRIDGVMDFTYDVSKQVRARQQVDQLNQELEARVQERTRDLHDTNVHLQRTNADLDTFVYAASHDLKAPIANIEGLLDALREYLPTREQEPMVPHLVGMMESAIQRFQQTVAYLTDVTRLQYGSEPVTGDVDVPAILEGVRLDLLPLLESTRTQLQLTVPACPGVRVPVKHLRSILFNLLSNAVKYRAPDRPPLVQVRAQCAAGRLVLEVQDNGLGLSATQQGQLFTMFRRLHTHVEGSGVGLYLIKRMIELAGGTISVESEPGVGSTFTVTLPSA